jgi:hypothetical protein
MVDRYPVASEVLANLAATRALVANHALWSPLRAARADPLDGPLGPQLHTHRRLMPLPRCEDEGYALAMPFGPEMPFGTESTLAAASRFSLRVPFVAPAAC